MIPKRDKIYFLSDAHLGSKIEKNPKAHELKLVHWLDKVSDDASQIFLLGDIFDFWFEYKTVVPKGFVRFFGKVSEVIDKGVPVHFFTGNHDIWAFEYFEKEIGMIVHRQPMLANFYGKNFFLAHGDNLDSTEKGFKLISAIFHSPFAQKLFQFFPPRLGQHLGYYWSEKSREYILGQDNSFRGEEKEELVRFSKKYVQNNDVDYLVFGHRHLDLIFQISPTTQMVILGDFVSIFSYGVFDEAGFRIEYF